MSEHSPIDPLFTPVAVGRWTLPTRIAMAPLTRSRSPDGVPPPMAVTYYRQRANPASGASLIVSEATAISAQGQGYSQVPGLYDTEQLHAWRAVTDAVHVEGGRIVVQMWHVGRISHESIQPDGQAPVAPSAIRANAQTWVLDEHGQGRMVPTSMPRALDAAELPGIVHAYVGAARNAIHSAGFDGVEIHAANGYLLDQFLKAGSNHRTDDYGGSAGNRARLLLEVLRGVADAIDADRVGVRLSPVTPANDAFDPDPQPLFEHVVREIAPLGLAYVHVIEGATRGARTLQDRPFDYDALRAAFRQAGGRAAWMVNNGYDAPHAAKAVRSGHADLVAFGRPFISNPDLAARMCAGAALAPADPATFYGGDEHGYTDYPAMG